MVPHTVGPFSSGEMPTADIARIEDLETKHRRIIELMSEQGLDAVLIQQPENFAWFTSGGDNTGRGGSEITAALFITSDARVVVGGNSDIGQIFDTEILGLGFQLKERPWFEPKNVLLTDLCRGRRVGSDTALLRTRDLSAEIAALRLPLTPLECDRMRKIGRQLSHAVEATARNIQELQSEAEVAGEVAHRLLKHEIMPIRISVSSDNRMARYRSWGFSGEPIRKACTIRAVGGRWGLRVQVSRTVSLGEPEPELLKAHQHAALIHATAMYFSQSNWSVGDILDRIRRIYEKFDHADEWRLAEQGHLIGYLPSELSIAPRSEFRLSPGCAVYWRPSIGPASLGDSVLVNPEGVELLTPMELWPAMEIAVKDVPLTCPGILKRD